MFVFKSKVFTGQTALRREIMGVAMRLPISSISIDLIFKNTLLCCPAMLSFSYAIPEHTFETLEACSSRFHPPAQVRHLCPGEEPFLAASVQGESRWWVNNKGGGMGGGGRIPKVAGSQRSWRTIDICRSLGWGGANRGFVGCWRTSLAGFWGSLKLLTEARVDKEALPYFLPSIPEEIFGMFLQRLEGKIKLTDGPCGFVFVCLKCWWRWKRNKKERQTIITGLTPENETFAILC